MSQDASSDPGQGRRRPKTVIVISGPRDGAGRTSLTAHLAVALLYLGREAGVIDLHRGSRGLSMWLLRRLRWVSESDADLVIPAAPIAAGVVSAKAESDQIDRWTEVLDSMSEVCDTVLVDAPSGVGQLAQRVHEDADLVLSLLTESALDLDRLFEMDANGRRMRRPSAYARMLWEARRRRGRAGHEPFTWSIARGRALPEGRELFDAPFEDAALLLGAVSGPRVRENVLWRAGMEKGLTALDPGAAPTEKREALAEDLRWLMIDMKIPGLRDAEYTF